MVPIVLAWYVQLSFAKLIRVGNEKKEKENLFYEIKPFKK
jgi:hypothetical protein